MCVWLENNRLTIPFPHQWNTSGYLAIVEKHSLDLFFLKAGILLDDEYLGRLVCDRGS